MEILNTTLRAVFDILLGPLASLPAWFGILLWSVPVSVFALLIFKVTSNQDRITAVKAKIHACLFEIRLFNDDIRAIFRAQWEIIGHVLHYQVLALKPMIWILPPLVLIMVQLHAFYGFRGLEPGDTAIVTATMKAKDTIRPDVRLQVPEGVSLETPGVWAPDLHQMAWRIKAESAGDFQLNLEHQGTIQGKKLRVTQSAVRLSPERPSKSFLDQLEWPSEPPLPADSSLATITLGYPEASLAFLGLEMESQWAWMILFFVLTMAIGLALKSPMGVEI
ncbi:MAG: hypothetical protein ABFS37_08135 [Acidobacteriota bacterium]